MLRIRPAMAAVARIAVDEHCYGIHWEVLDWNKKAIDLYTELGATFRDGWRPVLLSDDALQGLAEEARGVRRRQRTQRTRTSRSAYLRLRRRGRRGWRRIIANRRACGCDWRRKARA